MTNKVNSINRTIVEMLRERSPRVVGDVLGGDQLVDRSQDRTVTRTQLGSARALDDSGQFFCVDSGFAAEPDVVIHLVTAVPQVRDPQDDQFGVVARDLAAGHE